MAVGIKVDFLWFSIGTDDFFYSFFSTVCVNLENMKWGSRYPVIMKKLYSGKLYLPDMIQAKNELIFIKKELSNISPEKIVWDVENLGKKPPWGNNISEDIKNLADYFITSDGKNLIDVMNEALNEAMKEKVHIEVSSL